MRPSPLPADPIPILPRLPSEQGMRRKEMEPGEKLYRGLIIVLAGLLYLALFLASNRIYE